MTRLEPWILILVTGSTLVVWLLPNQDSNMKTGSNHWNNNHWKFTHRGINKGIITTRRTLKETNSMTRSGPKTEINPSNFNVEDYPHFDPTPDSKAGIKHGPIEHGTPLMPYIPRPSPPPSGPGHAAGSAPGPLGPPGLPPPHV